MCHHAGMGVAVGESELVTVALLTGEDQRRERFTAQSLILPLFKKQHFPCLTAITAPCSLASRVKKLPSDSWLWSLWPSLVRAIA